ncbi:MAG: hypothetical protein K0S33_1883 [Bacteroidetes bacterium]|jgi:hypothetical protein|nr:hypothetical protein [Bacteroidota bacterium]
MLVVYNTTSIVVHGQREVHNIGRALGRFVPFLGWGLTLWDIGATHVEYSREDPRYRDGITRAWDMAPF